MVTPGIIAYIDFDEADVSGGVYTFDEDIEKKLTQCGQLWLLHVPQGTGKTSGAASWNDQNQIRVNGVSGYFTADGKTLTQSA